MKRPLTSLSHRDHFGNWLTENGFTGTGVEIGTFRGEYAETLAKTWPAGKLFTCDPYSWSDTPSYKDGCVKDWNTMETLNPLNVQIEASARLANYPNVVLYVRESLKACNLFEPETLDFAYLDGDHSYENVKAELAAWWPKIRSGGIFGGHDFFNREDEYQSCGVYSAVSEWAAELGLKLHVTCCTSWWVLKP
jgi:hypothetical protein